jgi:hypothetical protein
MSPFRSDAARRTLSASAAEPGSSSSDGLPAVPDPLGFQGTAVLGGSVGDQPGGRYVGGAPGPPHRESHDHGNTCSIV